MTSISTPSIQVIQQVLPGIGSDRSWNVSLRVDTCKKNIGMAIKY